MAAGDKKERVPYFKYAFHNVYNYTILGGFAAAALATQNWWLAVAGLGAEALWMVFGPDSKAARKMLFDPMHDEAQKEAERQEIEKQLAGLPMQDARRFHQLIAQRAEIMRLANQNRSFTNELLKDELSKLEQLVSSFLELMISAHKHEEYLATIDVDELEEEMNRHRRIVRDTKDEDRKVLSEKNLEILTQRREKIAEIRRFVTKAHGQMDLIENTFRLLADQIVTMRSPTELGGQLDELIGGVEAVRTTARETEAFFQAVQG
jgi:hypothetical protein